MTGNPYVKPLPLFDPKKDLVVNEKFKPPENMTMDALSDLEDEDIQDFSHTSEEILSFKTGGPIRSGVISSTEGGSLIITVANKHGEVMLLTTDGAGFKPLKKFTIPGSIVRKPVLINGILYCTTREGMIYAIDTGLRPGMQTKPRIIWKQKLRKSVLTEILSTGKSIIVAPLDGLYCFEAYYRDDANQSIGKLLWRQALPGVVSSPVMHSGLIYVGAEDKKLYAFEYGGTKVSMAWSYDLSGACRMKPCISKKGNSILVSTIDGFVYSVDRSSGKYEWNFVIKNAGYSAIVSKIIDNEEYFFVGSDSGYMHCINSKGNAIWQFKTNGKIRTEPLIHGDRIYFGSEDNNLYALDLKTGAKHLQFSADGNINCTPIIEGSMIYFGSTDSFMYGLEI